MHNCERCKLRGRYDKNPASVLGKIWKWHTEWCPGWKSYLKSLPSEKRAVVVGKYRYPLCIQKAAFEIAEVSESCQRIVSGGSFR